MSETMRSYSRRRIVLGAGAGLVAGCVRSLAAAVPDWVSITRSADPGLFRPSH
jgi:hypothetical protein